MSLFRPGNHSCPLSAFPTFRISLHGRLLASSPRAMVFERKSYGLRPQEQWLSRRKAMVFEAKSRCFRPQDLFRSLIRTFELTLEGTSVRKNSNKFGFSLTYSYL